MPQNRCLQAERSESCDMPDKNGWRASTVFKTSSRSASFAVGAPAQTASSTAAAPRPPAAQMPRSAVRASVR